MKHLVPLIEPSWATAHDAAHALARPVSIEQVTLAQAVGRVLATPAISLMDLPGSTTSAMDGWVVADADGPWRLVASSLAGHPMTARLEPGTAAVIATGGVVPDGAYGVLRREMGYIGCADGTPAGFETDVWVHVGTAPDGAPYGEPSAGSHVRPAGQEAARDEVLVPAGRVLTPPQVGLVAMAGNDSLAVRREVRATLLVMGDEVRRDGLPAVGEVRDAFAPQLPDMARMLGLVMGPTLFVPDTLDAAVDAVRRSDADVVLTTGGTAAGPADFLHKALTKLGAELQVDQIAMRPGHPVLLASLGEGKFLVGLPGNPLSAMMGMLTLVRPLVRGLLGLPQVVLGEVVASEAVTAPARDSRLVPYIRLPDGSVRPTQWLGSGMLRGLASADGVMVVPAGGVGAGTRVPDLPLPW